MVNFIIAILASTGILSIVNVLIIRSFPDNAFLYLIVFLTNAFTVIGVANFFNKPREASDDKLEKERLISESSVSIFIKILLYLLPILALVGLYFVSVLDNKLTLGIEDANSWVSFILGIAAFVMSLITLWQSEGTYTKIFDALDELRRKTDDIKKNTDIIDVLRKSNQSFIEQLVPPEFVTEGKPASTGNPHIVADQDRLSIKEVMNSSQIFK